MAGTILVVDDQPDVLEVTAHVLEDAGFRVVQAPSGTEALSLARQGGIDLVVLDIGLPDIDGREVCRRLKTDPETSSLLVLHLSGRYRTAEERARGLEDGADAYLVQPVDPDELIATCRALLRTRRGSAALNLREVMALAAVVAATSGPLDLPETMRRIARETTRLIDADSGVFWIIDEGGTSVTPTVGYRVPKALLTGTVRSYGFEEVPQGMVDAFRGRRITVIPDTSRDPRWEGSVIRAAKPRAVVAVPVFLKDRLFGCLVLLWWREPHTPGDDELSLLATIAGQAALALENSRLYEETERERRTARAAEERYRAIFHGTPAPIFRSTVDGRMLECNDAFVRMLRYGSREDVLALNPVAFYADPADRVALLARLREDRLVSSHEVRWRRSDGSTLWVALTVRQVGDRAAHLDGVAIDVTDRKRAEEALAHYRVLFERSFVGMFRTRIDGTILECNDVFAKILGYAHAGELSGRSVVEHYSRPEDRQEIVARIAAGEDVVNAELVARRRDGSAVPVAMSVRRVTDPDADVVHEGILVDLTDRKSAEDAATLRLVAELANELAHKINDPLSVIVGDLELMLHGPVTRQRLERARGSADAIREFVSQMVRITRVARIASGPSDVPPVRDIPSSESQPEP